MIKQLLGDTVFAVQPSLIDVDAFFQSFTSSAFSLLLNQQKCDQISQTIVTLIQAAPQEVFLLPIVMHFIERVNRQKIVEHYFFSTFELWLNQCSGLPPAENYRLRGKLMGRQIPREEYQKLFPIGMGKAYKGPHFVTAHASPDLDTTVASFWGWVDAFSARVGEQLHLWNIPGGTPAAAEISLLFQSFFGDNLFLLLAKNRSSLSISSLDLLSQQGVEKKRGDDTALSLDLSQDLRAVLVVDPEGFYIGEWRDSDIDNVRFIITLLNQCLRWYENHLHVKLVAFFGTHSLHKADLEKLIDQLLSLKIKECTPAADFTLRHWRLVQDYLVKVLCVAQGIEATFVQFAEAMKKLAITDFSLFIALMDQLKKASWLKTHGIEENSRAKIFQELAAVIEALDKAIFSVRCYVERLEVALAVKKNVLELSSHSISHLADLEEIKSKIENTKYLTVTVPDPNGQLYPLGVIYDQDVYRTVLGTVTMRDFCNREETRIPPYLEIISVIDHHKSSLATSAPPVVMITDSQSSNSLVAQLSFALNDPYSSGGMTLLEIEQQIAEIQKGLLEHPSRQRILQKLLQKHQAARKTGFFVVPDREKIEYLHYLYAILDDTDLLTKVSTRDVETVAELLNRLKSLSLRKQVEVIHLDDIERDEKFAKKAAQKILRNEDMFSLYRKVYLEKEKLVEDNIRHCVAGSCSVLFADTKEQNGCCRVGQTKLFAKNFALFAKHAIEIRRMWLQQAASISLAHPEISFHLHMISTIAGAEEMYQGLEGQYKHQDEIWLWVPNTDTGTERLHTFLASFGQAAHVRGKSIQAEFLDANTKIYQQVFQDTVPEIAVTVHDEGLVMAILKIAAGSMNSRKSMISPYLPHLSS